MILLGIPLIVIFTGSIFVFGTFWQYFGLGYSHALTFIVVFSDSTLDMSVILSGSPFVLTLPGSTTPLKFFRLWYSLVVFVSTVLLIFEFPGRLANWNAPLQSFLL